MNGIIISALNRNIDIFYISNTSPITWSCDIKDAKIFESYLNAKNELEDNFISVRLVQSLKVPSGIKLLEQNSTSTSFKHPSNMPSHKSIIVDGNLTLVKLIQSLNASEQIVFTLGGIVMLFKLLHSKNALK